VNHGDLAQPDWERSGGLLPAIVQHWITGEILMLGYMNAEALALTRSSGFVTFWSRSRQSLWKKGETSGNVLIMKSIRTDCDRDALLIQADPHGPTCHLKTSSCFGPDDRKPLAFLGELDDLVAGRRARMPDDSYTTRLFRSGVQRIAQKVGEEAVETALAAVAQGDEALLGEAADLMYHLTVLLRARGMSLADVAAVLEQRHATATA
jgi:phosphoribosyl-ATP pyrophosphohydrolase/phosphoribosyl-AMP cyclohydrolase